ncbi:hypothetical protein BC834DRAFT_852761 [Gloeopeniophorella convolvens]|nr:hypothetical protein BC834DRAFT_852761 [Gloeopeniophorella convolvens]
MLNAQLLFEFALYFAELWETILFGLFTALLLFSVCVLIDRGLEETGRRILLAVMVLMWVIAVVHWAISIVITGYDTSGQIADSSLDKVAMVAVFLNLTISDAIVMSRAWHLWERSRVVLLISVLLAMLSFTSIVLNFSGLADSDIPVPEAVNAVAFLPQNEFAVEIGGLVAVIFSIVSNLWAFGLVATKAW